jgi:glycosyltransferase involved in cell wall biosynthesis
MKPLLSVVIPLFNAEKEVEICLNSLFQSSWPYFEVIIVDDCSTDGSLDVARQYPCRIYTMEKNSGPAAARNLGVSKANSDIILFLDSDTMVRKNSFKLFYDAFQDHPGIDAVLAVPDMASLRSCRASNYNSLRSHYTFISAEPVSDFFSTQMGAMRKNAFFAAGGFNEMYTGADIEDIELGMRLPPNKVLIHKDIIIRHHFPSFFSILKKYVRRANQFSKLLKDRKKLTGVHTNKKGMLSVISVLFSAIFLSLTIISSIIISAPGLLICLLLFLCYCIFSILFIKINLKLFIFTIKKKGPLYFVEAAFFEYVFSLAIGIGGFFSMFY